MKIKTQLLLVVLFFTFSFVNAQEGVVSGNLTDGELLDPMAFANIVVKGTTIGTTSDFDGKYQLNLEPGTYTLVFSFVGYDTQEINDVVIKPGEETLLDVTLNTNSLDTVVITTTVKRNTENAVLNIQKKSAVVLDGLSAQTIKKTGASNVASAVKSVPGVSVEGGKYVYVRGLGDRYTKSILNGVDIPGLDPDRNTIPMDIFPTNIIDNVIVLKSAAAEYPADFTGGIVNVVTKDFPTKAEYSIALGAAYNPDMHFKDNYLNYDGGDTDFFAYDDGSRNLPINRYQPIPNISENKVLLTSLTSRFDSQLRADIENSSANFNLGVTLGNQYEVGNDKLGYQASFSYKNNTTFYENAVDGIYFRNGNPQVNDLVVNRIINGPLGRNEVLVNGLIGLTYKTQKSKYKFTGIHIQNGESTASQFDILLSEGGGDGSGLLNGTNDVLLYTERSITNLSFTGNHTLDANSNFKLDWTFAPSFSKVEDKDHRSTPLRLREIGDNLVPQIDASSVGNVQRLWRTLNEENWVANVNFTKKYTLFNKPAKLKFGGAFTYKFRDFSTDRFLFSSVTENVPNGDVNTILSADNLWRPNTPNDQLGIGTYLDPTNKFESDNAYEGETHIAAMYISNEFNVSESLKVILGVRTEEYNLYYTGSKKEEIFNRENTISEFDFYPSANAIYALTDNVNLRGSYSRTTARPSFKEASAASIFDPITNRFFIGGFRNGRFDDIVPAYINNFDLRYEWFRDNGQMLAVSAFYKDFTDPIEVTAFPQAPRQQTVANLPGAIVYGAELEFRQNLGVIAETFSNFKFTTNLSIIESKATMTPQEFGRRTDAARQNSDGKVIETIDRKRDLQGQSPYLINVGLDYDNEDDFRAGLFYNVQGKTLEIVGNGFVPDVYTIPFNSLNVTLNKTFGENKRSAIDVKVNNILDSERKSEYESFGASNQTFSLRQPGVEFSLGYTYKF